MNLPPEIPKRVSRAHARFHGISRTVEGCWNCQRGYAMCLSKITYGERHEAELTALELNGRPGALADPVQGYPCDWSGDNGLPHWHVAHCHGARDRKKARSRQRRWGAGLLLPTPRPSISESFGLDRSKEQHHE